MAVNSNKTIVIGNQWVEGEVSLNTLLPISASSITQPAEAGSNVEGGKISLSTTGATGVPALNESAISQIHLPGENDRGKEDRIMTPMKRQGENPFDATSVASADTTRKTWFEVSLGDKGLEVAYSQLSGREIIDCLEDDAILNAQIVAAMRRFHEANLARATPEQAKAMRKSEAINLGFMVEGITDADLTLEIVLRALGVPNPVEMQEYSVPNVIEMMPDAIGYDSSTVDHLEDGDRGAVIQIRQGGLHSKKCWSENCGYLHMDFHGIDLDPMTVSEFGNFLYALIHHGEEVALATLHYIYENAG